MIVLDTNVVSDYITGHPAAASFFEEHEDEQWAVSTITVYETTMGAVHGHLDGDPAAIRAGVEQTFDVLPVDNDVVRVATALQSELLDAGVPVETQDALIAGTARYYGGRLVTNDQMFWNPAVRSVLAVAEYERE